MTIIIKGLLGHQNVSAESLHRLLDIRFATAEIYGKLDNIDAETIKDSNQYPAFKKLYKSLKDNESRKPIANKINLYAHVIVIQLTLVKGALSY